MNKAPNRILRGTFGKLWINDDPRHDVKSLEAKVTKNYEEIHANGDFGTYRRYMGYDISGTIVLHKVDSSIPRLEGDSPQTGVMQDIKIDFALTDPDVSGAQRVTLENVTLDEFTLGQFENNTVLEETVPFHASGYYMPEWLENFA